MDSYIETFAEKGRVMRNPKDLGGRHTGLISACDLADLAGAAVSRSVQISFIDTTRNAER
jgi:hypothetical protein